jgi:hypothetical protein
MKDIFIKLRLIEMDGAKISWDELICVEYKVTDKAIKKHSV